MLKRPAPETSSRPGARSSAMASSLVIVGPPSSADVGTDTAPVASTTGTPSKVRSPAWTLLGPVNRALPVRTSIPAASSVVRVRRAALCTTDPDQVSIRSQSTLAGPTVTPMRLAATTSSSAVTVRCRAPDGIQPAWTHVPPRPALSMSVTRAPNRAAVRAAATPPGPPPTTSRSVTSRGCAQRPPNIHHQRAASRHAGSRRAVHHELALAVEGDRAAGRVEGHLLARLEEPKIVYNNLRREARSQHRLDSPSRPAAHFQIEATRVVSGNRMKAPADRREADRPRLRAREHECSHAGHVPHAGCAAKLIAASHSVDKREVVDAARVHLDPLGAAAHGQSIHCPGGHEPGTEPGHRPLDHRGEDVVCAGGNGHQRDVGASGSYRPVGAVPSYGHDGADPAPRQQPGSLSRVGRPTRGPDMEGLDVNAGPKAVQSGRHDAHTVRQVEDGVDPGRLQPAENATDDCSLLVVRDHRGQADQPANVAARCRVDYEPDKRRAQASRSASAWRKRAAGAPSTSRWSNVIDSHMVGWTRTSPSTTMGLSTIRPTPRMAHCGGFTIGVKESAPNAPRLEMVNVPPSTSSRLSVPFWAFVASSARSPAISRSGRQCASRITGTISPSSRATATPT